MRKINKVSIIGMGALGMLYGEHILKSKGPECLSYIMDSERYERYKDCSFKVNGEALPFNLIKASDAAPADLVIVAVKATGLDKAIADMEKAVGPETIIVSVLNGITSEQKIGERYGLDKVVHCVAQGMDAKTGNHELTYVNPGELILGIVEPGRRENLEAVMTFGNECGITCREEKDIMYRIWSKLMCNVGINQCCMVYDVNYGDAIIPGTEVCRTYISAMREVIAVANAEGVALTEDELNQYHALMGRLDPEGLPSMAQDRKNRKPSEVESFAGTVIEYGRKHGIMVPVNEWLYERVRDIEAGY